MGKKSKARLGKACVEITHYNRTGAGVGALADAPFDVVLPGAARGEVVEAELLGGGKRQKYGRVVSLQSAHPGRRALPCLHFGPCGGCPWLFLQPEAAFEEKIHQFKTLVAAQLGQGAVDLVVEGMPSPKAEAYRYRASFAVGGLPGHLKLGAYRPRSHEIVDVGDCLVTHPRLLAARDGLWRALDQTGLAPYDEKAGSGRLRHVQLQLGDEKDAILALLVVNGLADGHGSGTLAHYRRLAEGLVAEGVVQGLVLNVQESAGNRILGPQFIPLAGAQRVDLNYVLSNGRPLRIAVPSGAFSQVNHGAAQRLYQRVWQWAKPAETLVDLFCGVGAIGLGMAGQYQRVVGLELNAAAIEMARYNAQRNGVTHAEYHAGRVEPGALVGAYDDCVAVVNPPRSGLGTAGLAVVEALAPRQLLYISCGPQALLRDLAHLLQGDYSLQALAPHDLFPQTHHLEVIARLERRSNP